MFQIWFDDSKTQTTIHSVYSVKLPEMRVTKYIFQNSKTQTDLADGVPLSMVHLGLLRQGDIVIPIPLVDANLSVKPLQTVPRSKFVVYDQSMGVVAPRDPSFGLGHIEVCLFSISFVCFPFDLNSLVNSLEPNLLRL